MERPLVLGIETSCDDTACALVDGAGRVLASVVSSPARGPPAVRRRRAGDRLARAPRQLAGGARPRRSRAPGVGIDDVDAVAATRGPGLVGSLLVGLSLGRALAWARGLPFLAVHHLEGHLFSPCLDDRRRARRRGPGAVRRRSSSRAGTPASTAVAGGRDRDRRRDPRRRLRRGVRQVRQAPRSALSAGAAGRPPRRARRRRGARRLPRLAGTRGALLLLLGVEDAGDRRARDGSKRAGRPPTRRPSRRRAEPPLPQPVLDLVAGFRDSAVRQVLDRLTRLHRRAPFARLAVSGGAAANRLLRRRLPDWAAERGVDLRLVPLVYSGDNAAMIAFAAALRRERAASVDDPLAARGREPDSARRGGGLLGPGARRRALVGGGLERAPALRGPGARGRSSRPGSASDGKRAASSAAAARTRRLAGRRRTRRPRRSAPPRARCRARRGRRRAARAGSRRGARRAAPRRPPRAGAARPARARTPLLERDLVERACGRTLRDLHDLARGEDGGLFGGAVPEGARGVDRGLRGRACARGGGWWSRTAWRGVYPGRYRTARAWGAVGSPADVAPRAASPPCSGCRCNAVQGLYTALDGGRDLDRARLALRRPPPGGGARDGAPRLGAGAARRRRRAPRR